MLLLVYVCRYVSSEQNFPICTDQTQPGPDGCQHVGFNQLVLNPLALYLTWQVLYIAVVRYYLMQRNTVETPVLV